MNPQEQEHTPSFELPPARNTEQGAQPLPEQGRAAGNEAQNAIAIEHGAVRQSTSPPPQFSSQSTQQAQPQSSQPASPAVGAVSGQMPQIADDTDLIEKEWVIKAKEIVAQTAHDPHLQNREMNKFKADYLKKRYNKELKLSEDT